MSVLAAKDVAVTLGGQAVLSGVSFALKAGEVTAIVGPNGAGKSTLLDVLAGLRRPDAGLVRLDERSLASVPARERARAVAYLPQTPEIAWAVSVRTLVGLGRTAHVGALGLGADDHAAVEEALQATAMTRFAGRLVQTLSGGERARALIARALAGQPRWILADEPLAGLDPGHVLDTVDLFRGQADQGLGVVVTLHDLSVALRLADRVIVLAHGRLLADGDPEQALRPEVLATAYGVEARQARGAAGLLIEVIGRSS